MVKTQIGGVETERTYRPARIVCDVVSLVLFVVIAKLGTGLTETSKFLETTGLIVPLMFPAAAIALCAAYIWLSFHGARFKRLKITEQNAQTVYDWYTFTMSLVKIPLMIALLNGEFIYRDWAAFGTLVIGAPIIIDVLLAALIIWFAAHRIKALCEMKQPEKTDSAVKVKVKVVDDETKTN